MMSWQSLLHDDPVPWLLEKGDPAVRASTLRHLLDRGPRDGELREAQQRAMSSPPLSTILRQQKSDGSWPGQDLWKPKYQSTHWSSLLLVEYGEGLVRWSVPGAVELEPVAERGKARAPDMATEPEGARAIAEQLA